MNIAPFPGRRAPLCIALIAALPLSETMRQAAVSDDTTSISAIKASVLAFARDRDWEQFHSPKNLSMAIAAEAAELMEHFLWAPSSEGDRQLADPAKLGQIREELADIIIYALEFANVAEIDIAQAIADKMSVNAQKYPIKKAKGRSEKYTLL